MNRIVILRFDLLGPATVAPAFVNKTSGLLRRRHVSGNYFGDNLAGFRTSHAAAADLSDAGSTGSWETFAGPVRQAGSSIKPAAAV
jgi:hypothetical protein